MRTPFHTNGARPPAACPLLQRRQTVMSAATSRSLAACALGPTSLRHGEVVRAGNNHHANANAPTVRCPALTNNKSKPSHAERRQQTAACGPRSSSLLHSSAARRPRRHDDPVLRVAASRRGDGGDTAGAAVQVAVGCGWVVET